MVSRADQDAAAETLRANIARLRRLKKLTQRALGSAAGMENPDQTISDFMSSRAKQLDYAYLKPLAKALGCELSDLFSPVQESTGRSSSVTAVRSSSSSNVSPGDADGTQARLLRAENAQLIEDNAALRAAIKDAGKQLIKLAAMGKKARRAQGAKLSTGGRD